MGGGGGGFFFIETKIKEERKIVELLFLFNLKLFQLPFF